MPVYSKYLIATAAIGMAALLSACQSMVYDDEGDCTPHYHLAFRYTKNVLNSDAFGAQVTGLNVALYSKEGALLLTKHAERDATVENGYLMEVEADPGDYDILAWCEGEASAADAVSFTLSGFNPGDRMPQSEATLPLTDINDTPVAHRDITPLFHGLSRNVTFPVKSGNVVVDTLYLTKDTNRITVMLQNTDGSALDPDSVAVTLEACNSTLNYENQLTGDTKFHYMPWQQKSITADTKAGDTPSGIMAMLSTGRLMADVAQQLTVIHKSSGREIISIPLLDYLMLVRDNYPQATSNQDYLDRIDDYTLVFFLQEGYNWLKTRIIINGWRVVPPQTGNQ